MFSIKVGLFLVVVSEKKKAVSTITEKLLIEIFPEGFIIFPSEERIEHPSLSTTRPNILGIMILRKKLTKNIYER